MADLFDTGKSEERRKREAAAIAGKQTKAARAKSRKALAIAEREKRRALKKAKSFERTKRQQAAVAKRAVATRRGTVTSGSLLGVSEELG